MWKWFKSLFNPIIEYRQIESSRPIWISVTMDKKTKSTDIQLSNVSAVESLPGGGCKVWLQGGFVWFVKEPISHIKDAR